MGNLSDYYILVFLGQFLLILVACKFLAKIFSFAKLPPIAAELTVGILLGATVLGRVFPNIYTTIFPADKISETMINTVAWIGILFLLLDTGMKTDFQSAIRQKGEAFVIAISDIIVPIIVAFVPVYFLINDIHLVEPEKRVIFSFFIASIMTISALPITARILNDLNVIKTEAGVLVVSALLINDIFGWVIFTIILGIFVQAGYQEISRIALVFVFTIGFTGLFLTVGRVFVHKILKKISSYRSSGTESTFTFVVLLGLLSGLLTHVIGIQALIGFFVAGVIAGDSEFMPEKTKNVVFQNCYAVFVPVFFAVIGIRIDFLSHFNIFLCLLIFIIGTVGRYFGAWFGTLLAKTPKSTREFISVAHTPGGEVQIVIGLIALQTGLITEQIFVAIFFGALASSFILGPWLKSVLKKRKEVSMSEFFVVDAIIDNLQANEKFAALKEIIDHSHEKIGLDIDYLYSHVVAREKLVSTGLENGIAVPHARFDNMKSPMVVFAKSVMGVEWNSPDGQPTHFIFLILTAHDDNDLQIQILSSIAKKMLDVSAQDKLLAAKNKSQIKSALMSIFREEQIKNNKIKSRS